MATVNPWKKFLGLLPGSGRAVGAVMSVDIATGISILQLRNGSEFAARGVEVAVGSKAFVVDGQVTGPAPNLPHYDVEV